jgi:predicted glutamine amidotransferase
MCRWLAYSGPALSMDALLLKPQHSFIRQSVHAWKSAYAVSGDGAGVGWYGAGGLPGLYREIRPAWNDENLHNLAAHVRSHMFLAHVRATSGSVVQRTNCHPFGHGRWLFQHNGEIAGYARLKQDLDRSVRPELYPAMQGSADSERMLFLALTLGLEREAPAALARMAGAIESLGREKGIDAPLAMTLAVADGRRLYCVRYSSGGRSPTLYYSDHPRALRLDEGGEEELPAGAVILLSEPLDEVSSHWREVPEATLMTVERGAVRLEPFVPIRTGT